MKVSRRVRAALLWASISSLALATGSVGCRQSLFVAPPNDGTPRTPPIDLGVTIYDRDLGDLSFYFDQAEPDDLSKRHEDLGVSTMRDLAVPDLRKHEDLSSTAHTDLSHHDMTSDDLSENR